MREKVIFDTNTVRNTENGGFLGGRRELEQFLKYADILIPDTVIQEIKRQKRKNLNKCRDQFLKNPFITLLGINKDDVKAFNIDNYIQKLYDDEDIPFELIDLTDYNILPQIKNLAIHKQAPFESDDKTDKGFKDTLIYFTILEYQRKNSSNDLFVCTKDILLKKALSKHPDITVVEDYEEFKQKSFSQFQDDYFIEKVKDEIGIDIKKEYITEYWKNINYNYNVRIKTEDKEYIVEVDSGEIVGYSQPENYELNVEKLINSKNFKTTHSMIEELTPYTAYFTDDEILEILNASYLNNQIKMIIDDYDVEEFISPLYNSRVGLVDNDVAIFLKEYFK